MSNTSGSTSKWLVNFIKPYKTQATWAVIFLFIASLAWLSLGQIIKLVIDADKSSSSELLQLVAIMAVIIMFSSIATYGRFYLMSLLGEKISNDIRYNVFASLINLDQRFFKTERTGEVISRFTADITLVQNVVSSSFSMTLRSGVTLIGGLLLMAISSIKMTLIIIAAIPLVFLPILILGRKVRAKSSHNQDKVADMGAFIDESLHEIKTVQAYNHQSASLNYFSQCLNQILRSAKSRIAIRALLIAVVMFISSMCLLGLVVIGLTDVASGKLSPGELTAFLFYALMVAGASATISEVASEVQKALGASDRLRHLASQTSSLTQSANPAPLNSVQQIQFTDVNFSFDGNVAALKGINLTIEQGQRIAIVGPSGAGKSTLINLLQRFYDATSGQILFDGKAICSYRLEDIRKQFAVVSQDSVIFAMSVIDNVRFARPDATEAEVILACKQAYCDEFIEQLAEGYHSQLGERGVNLSGGQKQRLAIARALLSQRPILLFDEATSALDGVSEKAIQTTLASLLKTTTSITIAHRLSTVIEADIILVMDQGAIIDCGSHTQLLEKSKLYQKLAASQLLQ
ncbi:ABC transporter transmembrane domain-containing protein [Paraferrimonas sp. SM1919]|uniref:ABC transporter transmembrane domain-containing protein n=1 Tax=Paraferrimonas sp. SM1919 TaxID=2662263 RepID=UPI0013D2D860|nr:ABC transporter transmembrane domain-containing protein [Paraferrimonas sp. SM1919]